MYGILVGTIDSVEKSTFGIDIRMASGCRIIGQDCVILFF